jgi:hypothetical protein
LNLRTPQALNIILNGAKTMNVKFLTYALMATALTMAACSSEQVYNSGKAWRMSECDRIENSQERARCREEANRSYDEYERDREGQRPEPTNL